MKRRILASLLSLVMTLSLLPATALAEGEIMTVSEDTEAVGKPEEVTEPTPQAGDGENTIETTTNGQLDLAEAPLSSLRTVIRRARVLWLSMVVTTPSRRRIAPLRTRSPSWVVRTRSR